MNTKLNDVSHSLQLADEINLTPTKELVDKVTLDPKYSGDLLVKLKSDCMIITACEKTIEQAVKSLDKALSVVR